MEAGASLRILVKRCLNFNGDYRLDSTRGSIILPTFTVYSTAGKVLKKIKAGDVVKIVSNTSFSIKGRVVSLRPSLILYTLGTVHGPQLFDETDEVVTPALTFHANEDVDLTQIPEFGKLYVHERGSL
jgi:hypothetical protein